MRLLRTIDLCSGAGGMALGLRRWTKVVAYCEMERHCIACLLENIRKGRLDRAPVATDVRSFLTSAPGLGRIDMIAAGWPCQDISSAGKRRGLRLHDLSQRRLR